MAVPQKDNVMLLAGAADSRSTSAGSLSSGEPIRETSRRSTGLPEFEYPVPVVIRNTFIDTQVPRPLSLDDFFEERRIHSCPVGIQDDVHGDKEDEEEDEDESPIVAQPLRRAVTTGFATGAQAFMTTVAAATGFWNAPLNTASAAPAASFNATETRPPVLMLSEALPMPLLGSNEMPTVGSAGHNIGNCKPCAFFHTRGCGNGVQCSFCHLCPPDEKRKRQKEKVAMLRAMRQQERRQVRL